MNERESFFQIVITYPDGSTAVVPLIGNRVNIGSRSASQLRLEGDDILPNHARVLVTSGSTVLFIDLSSEPSVPVKWDVDETFTVGSYALRLAQGVDKPLEQEMLSELLEEAFSVSALPDDLPEATTPPRRRPPLPRTPLPEEIFERADDLLETMSERGKQMTDRQSEPARTDTASYTPPAIMREAEFNPTDTQTRRAQEMPALEGDRTTQRVTQARKVIDALQADAAPQPPAIPEEMLLPADDDFSTQMWQPDEEQGTQPYTPTNGAQLVIERLPDENEGTQPYTPANGAQPMIERLMESYAPSTDWHYNTNLSAQLTMNPVTVVVGERVRVPVSVHNGNVFGTTVRLVVAGQPGGWESAPTPRLTLQPGELRSADLLIQIRPDIQQPALELAVLVSDVMNSDITVQLPLKLVLKRDLSLSGRLEKALVRDKDTAYLSIQNHAAAEAQVFIGGQAEGGEVEVVLPENELWIGSGQSVRVPVQFRAQRRPLLREKRRAFWLAAQEGSRAPLDYRGVVRVAPRLGWLALLILLFIGIEVLVAVFLVLNAVA